MKRKLILAICIASLAPTVEAQITNPSFENGLTGWNNNGFQTQTNESPSTQGWVKDGTTYAEKWISSTERLPQSSILQTVRLTAGLYTLQAEGHSYCGVDTSTTCWGVKLFGAGRSVAVKKGGTYQVRFTLPTERLVTIGFGCDHTEANWIAVDNFRLTHTTDNAMLRTYLDSICAVAAKDTTTTIKLFNTQIHEALDAASSIGNNTSDLLQAIARVDSSITAYSDFYYDYLLVLKRRSELNSLLPNDYPNHNTIVNDITSVQIAIRRNGPEAAGMTFDQLLDHIDSIYVSIPPFEALSLAISKASKQLKLTQYPSAADFKTQINKAINIKNNFTSITQLDSMVTLLTQQTEAYLATRPSEWITIQNGKLWKTDTGATVQAHAPGFVRVGDIWYMCGEDRTNTWNPDVNLYASCDLKNWTFVKKIIQNGVTDSRLGSSRMIERPKLLYNQKTGKYVVWCHWESGNYGAQEAACFSCDSVDGAYQLVWCGQPASTPSRDCNVFQDSDGTAYFISTINSNTDLGLFRLSDDYYSVVEKNEIFKGQYREAPAIVRLNDTYFMFNSACSGWDPNQQKMAYTSNLKNGWTSLISVGNNNAYDTQAAAILAIKGTKTTTYLYVGDRWQDPDLASTKTIIFPITFDGTNCTFAYHERFDINFVTGEWRETPTDTVFVDKTGWTVIAYSSQETSSEYAPAQYAIDGKTSTKWHTQYSGTVASAPHYITVKMGRTENVKGFLAIPRMDGNTNGLIREYSFDVSTDGSTWITVSNGTWLPYCTEVDFTPCNARYFRFTATSGTYASLAEINLIQSGTATDINFVKNQLPTTNKPVATYYYTLDGRRIDYPVANGIVIVDMVYEDGTNQSHKFIVGKK